MTDIDDLVFNEQWSIVLEEISKDKNLIGKIEPYDLAWKRFQYQLADNKKEELIAPFGDLKDLLKIIFVGKTVCGAELLRGFGITKTVFASWEGVYWTLGPGGILSIDNWA